MDKELAIICGFGGLIVLLLIAMVNAAVKEEERWAAFKTEHNCKVVATTKARSRVGTGLTSNGQVGTVVLTDPSTTTWLCDDEVEYTR